MGYNFNTDDIVYLLQKVEPTINYSLLQTKSENRDDLKQHLYGVVIKTLKNTTFSRSKGLFKD